MSTKSTSGTGVIPKPSLSQYVFAEKLGAGSYASVYKAYRKTGIREVVAIKCVLRKNLNKTATENLLTEIELLKRLHHDHIVELKDFHWDPNYIYLIMEYCSSGDLSKFIHSRRALPEHIVKKFLQQIASAMKYLWDNNVSHMDLKPQNVLLTSPAHPQIKLADFGFAQHLYDGVSLHAMRGSPLYMAPEIICQGQYDSRVDLWSIGVILYECLFGQAPFASKSFSELGKRIWDDTPIEIPQGFNISPSCRDLIMRLLKRDPDKRIKFAEFFIHPFVDLEHLPNKRSLPNAIKTVTEAVTKDKNGDYKEAVKLYCDAVAFFMPAIHYERDHKKKNALRAKVKEYMDRAEVLKRMMKPQSLASSLSREKSTSVDAVADVEMDDASKRRPDLDVKKISSNDSLHQCPIRQDTIDELVTLCEDSPKLVAALKVITVAIREERNEDYRHCLQHYELALGAVLKLLPDEQKGKRKDLLKAQVQIWMNKAEEIKSYLEVQNLNTNDDSMLEEDQVDLSQSRQCVVQ